MRASSLEAAAVARPAPAHQRRRNTRPPCPDRTGNRCGRRSSREAPCSTGQERAPARQPLRPVATIAFFKCSSGWWLGRSHLAGTTASPATDPPRGRRAQGGRQFARPGIGLVDEWRCGWQAQLQRTRVGCSACGRPAVRCSPGWVARASAQGWPAGARGWWIVSLPCPPADREMWI